MRRRSAFSLVEVLVSMALILFIMSILAGAFGAASQAVSDLKAAGDLAEKLRSATNVIKHDLGQAHFTDAAPGATHLSDANFWDRLDATKIPAPPPPLGFFRIYETAKSAQEGGILDLDNLPSFTQTTAVLHYTITQYGTRRSDFLSALAPNGSVLLLPSAGGGPYANLDNFYQDTANVFSSPMAEVELFLAPTGDVTDGSTGTGPQPLFALFRRQQLAVPVGWSQTSFVSNIEQNFDVEMSMSNGQITSGLNNGKVGVLFNTMQDLSMPGKRFNCTGNPAGNPPGGTYPQMPAPNTAADLLLTDVLSFDVRILKGTVNAGAITRDNEFRDIGDNDVQFFNTGKNPAYPQGAPPFIFDTWSNLKDSGNAANDYTNWNTAGAQTSVPVFQDASGKNRIVIMAIQITLRVWDFKTKKARQVTVVQQM